MPVRTVVERGPKGKRSVAFSIDWPGWSRGARSVELALETLEAYRDRYRPVASLARLAREFDSRARVQSIDLAGQRVTPTLRIAALWPSGC